MGRFGSESCARLGNRSVLKTELLDHGVNSCLENRNLVVVEFATFVLQLHAQGEA